MKICQRSPPPQDVGSHRPICVLNTPWARESQENPSFLSGNCSSAAVMAARPQKTWSSLPYFISTPYLLLKLNKDRRAGSYQITTVIRRHIVTGITRLPLQPNTQLIIIRVVPREMPILQQSHKHGTSFPPFSRKCTGDLSSLIAVIPSHHPMGGRAGGIFDGFCMPLVKLGCDSLCLSKNIRVSSIFKSIARDIPKNSIARQSLANIFNPH